MSYQLSLGVLSTGAATEWMLILYLPHQQQYHWLLSSNGPGTGDPFYKRLVLETKGLPEGLVKNSHIAYLREQDVWGAFETIYHNTIPGPNKWFIVRFLDQIAQLGLIKPSTVDKWRLRAVYSVKEKEHFYNFKTEDSWTYVDRVFRKSGVHADESFHSYYPTTVVRNLDEDRRR
ncbi:hypothetical protein BDV06DRAFT_226582 [Aspergillus oleicola]